MEINKIIIITFFCALMSFISVYLIMPKYIDYLKKINFNQRISEYSLIEFQQKAKTPIMGGVLFVIIPIIINLLLMKFNFLMYKKEMLVLFSFFSFGLIGFIDDYLIIAKSSNEGLKPKYKLFLQIILSIIIALILKDIVGYNLIVPFFKINIDLSYFYILLVIIILGGESNAVNFTDGMDGLCAGTVSIALFFYSFLALLNNQFYLFFIIVSVIFALIAYLKYNFFPAKIFMGDSGSLALGALIGILALVLKKEFALIFLGGTFLWEIASVMIQIFAVKVFKKRVFLYTPIHYSFSKKGMPEKKVVLMFYLITIILSFIGFIIGIF